MTKHERWIEEFVESLADADMSPLTIRSYRSDTKLFFDWIAEQFGPRTGLKQISSIDLIEYRRRLVDEEKRPTTINRNLQALRRFFRWAEERRLVGKNPCEEIKTMNLSPRYQPMGLKEREALSLFRAAKASSMPQRNVALVNVLVQSGLRVSELVCLLVGDVKLSSRSGFVRVRDGKGHKARDIPLNATARRCLTEYLDTRDYTSRHPLFMTNKDTQMSVRGVQKLISDLGKRANITRLTVSPHTLRHTFALNYLKKNPGKLVELASLLGHESLDTTAIYTQPSAESLAQDVERTVLNIYGQE